MVSFPVQYFPLDIVTSSLHFSEKQIFVVVGMSENVFCKVH